MTNDTHAAGRRVPASRAGEPARPRRAQNRVPWPTLLGLDASDRRALACLVALAAALALQQVRAEHVWWDLARGRAVLAGAVAPCRALSAADPLAEADWLGGVPWYLLDHFGGISGLMLARLAGCAIVLAVCLRQAAAGGPAAVWRTTAAAGAALVAVAPALDPTGGWWDVVLGWLAATIPLAPAKRLRGLFSIAALAAVWANLGPRSLLVIGAAGRAGPWGFLAAGLGLSLTPRGMLGLLDSARILAPPASVAWFEGETPGWLAGFSIAGEMPVAIQGVAWGALAATAAVTRHGPLADVGRLLGAFALHALLLANPASLPALAPWLWRLGTAPPPPAAEAASAASHRGTWPARLVALVVVAVAVMAATGPWPGIPWRLGWGLAPRLEQRQLGGPLAAVGPEGTAFAFDPRAAGMAAWTLPRGPRPWLVPQRALLAGRFVAEARIAADLRTGRDMQHRRADGTTGGWWVPLTGRGTRLLFVPDDDTATIRRLEPGIFKPLVIDAPVVPYGPAGDPELSPAILRGLADRQLVERGAWTYALPRSLQTDRSLDLWGLLTGRPDPRPLLRQADVFLAMRLPLAALKILVPLQAAGVADCRSRIVDATLAVAERERLALGAPSAFRAAVLARLDGRPAAGSPLAESLAHASADSHALLPIVAAYLSGGASAALDATLQRGGGDLWTRAMLALEAGQTDGATEALDMLRGGDDPVRAAAAADLLEALHQAGTTP